MRNIYIYIYIFRVAPHRTEQPRYTKIFRTLFWSTVITTVFTLLDRASFPHYNNTKIIKFGWELLILWLISYGLSFLGFARFPDTINDSFSSTCANTYQHSTNYKEISVPMKYLDCKSLSLNSIVILARQYTDHWTQYSLNYGRPKLSLIVTRNSGNRASPRKKINIIIIIIIIHSDLRWRHRTKSVAR